MGIFLVPVPPKSRGHMLSAEDRLWTARQDGRPLERYVEEFVELSSKVNWPDAILNTCFLRGLDEDTIRYLEPECLFSLVESINLILFLNGSEFEIEEVQSRSCFPRPAPSEIRSAWPVHQPPISSTYHSSGHSPGLLPDPTHKPPKRKSSKRSRRSKRVVTTSPEPPTFLEPAPAFHEPPKEAEWLIDFGVEPTVPAFHEPAPGFLEPLPAFREPAPAFRRARSSSRQARLSDPRRALFGPRRALSGLQTLASPPTLTSPRIPSSHQEFPQDNFLGRGHVPMGAELLGGVLTLQWPAKAPDPPWPPTAPDPPWPPIASDPPWSPELLDPP
ncbi:hypothetical protein DPX16_12694 [Anabarilius grahami]|uniref:Uncharacterized protein n=1 Tax=Anabarilius grahami TaxID=495550 RepID=A0A3N0XTG6_ANAGA|nr:hypothetical protein DPX16_12694 [Anabarilius grahami]